MFQSQTVLIDIYDLIIYTLVIVAFFIGITVLFMYTLNVINNNRRNKDLDKKITEYFDLLSVLIKKQLDMPLTGKIVDLTSLDKQAEAKQNHKSKNKENKP